MQRFVKQADEKKELHITYFSKESIKCPACDAAFYRENLLSGGGRLNAGPLTDELRREWLPSGKYGDVFPLIYEITVCPSCYYAAFSADFSVANEKIKAPLAQDISRRITDTQLVFPNLDFASPRKLVEGVASYYLAARCYEYFTKEYCPTFKMALSTLRAAWLFDSMNKKFPDEHYDYLREIFYRKALFLYKLAMEFEQKGKEPLGGVKNYGPDTDKSYGYEGILYIIGILEFKYGPRTDPQKRMDELHAAKIAIGKMFGLGKSSKSKPGPLLEKSRELYDKMSVELQESEEDTADNA
jgi:uncharacterized protein (DUF2225 family)